MDNYKPYQGQPASVSSTNLYDARDLNTLRNNFEKDLIMEQSVVRNFIEQNEETVFYLPFVIAQAAIGQTDGGIASIFDCDASGDEYGSVFANYGGHEVVSLLLSELPADTVLSRLSEIKSPDVTVFFKDPSDLLEAEIPSITSEVVDVWFNSLKSVFPEISAEKLEGTQSAAFTAVSNYLRFEHHYSDEFNNENPHVDALRALS